MTPDAKKIPTHIAIIMDGNGRWAAQRGLPRIEGHKAGAKSVETILHAAARCGVSALTLYCLSSENWKRPPSELDALMMLLKNYLCGERERLMRENIRLKWIGRRTGIPADVLAELDAVSAATAENSGLILTLAINYGGRGEIVDAARRWIVKAAASPHFDPDRLDEELFASQLTTVGLPDPDLLIRTAGESRLSNFLLWQLSYAEIWVTPVCWPDFDESEWDRALAEFARRTRKFGGLAESMGELSE